LIQRDGYNKINNLNFNEISNLNILTFAVMESNQKIEVIDIVKAKEKKKKKRELDKGILNIIRTTMRNNIELTHIADNKANVLLSLNALMLTFLIPFAIPYIDFVKEYKLFLPLTVLVVTCFIVIYLSALVLKPGKFFHNQKALQKGKYVSPFFFGNYYQMNKEEFMTYFKNALSKKGLIKSHIAEDLHYIGSRLGRKMTLIRIAFNIFMIGLFISISLSVFLLFIYSH